MLEYQMDSKYIYSRKYHALIFFSHSKMSFWALVYGFTMLCDKKHPLSMRRRISKTKMWRWRQTIVRTEEMDGRV